jgi:hypothetical protein
MVLEYFSHMGTLFQSLVPALPYSQVVLYEFSRVFITMF